MDGAIQEEVILGLDLSTTCTGWALIGKDSKKLLQYGRIKGSSAGTSKMGKIRATLFKMQRLAEEIKNLVAQYEPSHIVIEEIAGSKNRLGQKTLDGFHFVVLIALDLWLDQITFYDVTGANGWRTHLKLKLDDADKANNKEAKKLNKKLARGVKKLPIIGPKHLAARYVNNKFGLALDVDENTTDADVADAIALTDAFATFAFTKA